MLTSPQITDESQFLMRRSLGRATGRARAVPGLGPRPVPGHHRRGPSGLGHRRLHDHRPVPAVARRSMEVALPWRRRRCATGTSTTSATPSRRSWTPTTAPSTLYVNDPTDPLIATWAGRLSHAVHAALASCRTTWATPALPGGPVQCPDRDVRGVPRARSRPRSTRATTCGPCPPAAGASSQVLPSEAYYVQMRLPGAQMRRSTC